MRSTAQCSGYSMPPSCMRPHRAPARARGSAVVRRYQIAASDNPFHQERITGTSYTDVVQQLAERALSAKSASTSVKAGSFHKQQQKPGQHYIVGIAGAPGSGKTTLAQLVADRINSLVEQSGTGHPAIVVPMDGFHLYRWQLDQMPHPEEAYARRGAPWTFDADAFVTCIRSIRSTGTADVPSFDHGVGDPVLGDIRVTPEHGVVLVEGNYLFLEEEPWVQLQSLFDDTWFVDVDVEVAMQRVFERQVALGLDPAVSKARIAGNDRPNALLVNATRGVAKVLVPSDIPL